MKAITASFIGGLAWGFLCVILFEDPGLRVTAAVTGGMLIGVICNLVLE